MLEFLRKIKKPSYEPFNEIQIAKGNLLFNYNYLCSLREGAEIWPVLKSNAYGYGLKEVCQVLNETSAKKVVVDSYPEAQIVYRYFQGRVLILAEMALGAYKYCDFRRTEFVVYNFETLKFLKTLKKRIKVHVFLNTGMNREGLVEGEFEKWFDFLKSCKDIELVGLCSHFASADEDSSLNQKQMNRFEDLVNRWARAGFSPKWLHLGNSAGVGILPEKTKCNAYRTGLVFYGYSPFQDNHPSRSVFEGLKPALRVVSRVVGVQDLVPGDRVSYGETFVAKNKCKIAIIPFGYFEGLDRAMSNKVSFKIIRKNGEEFWAQIAGRVCMNITVLNCGGEKVKVGDKVEVIGMGKNKLNSVESISGIIETIPYEVLVKLERGSRRIIV